MDPRTSSQDVIRCDLCEKAVVEMYCDTCLVNLCSSCVGKHFSADFSKPHKIVNFKDRRSTLIFPACANHSNKKCKSFCEDCGIQLCLKCVVCEDSHKDHQLSLMEDKFSSKKQTIERDLKILTEEILPTYKYIEKYIHIRKDQVEKEYDYIANSILEHGAKLHKEIDNFVYELLGELAEMNGTHKDALNEKENELDGKLKTLKDSIDFCENLIYSNDVSLVMGYAPDIEKYRQFPSNINAVYPMFSPKIPKTDELKSACGNLTQLSFVSDDVGFSMKIAEETSHFMKHTLDDWFSTSEPERLFIIDTEEIVNVACLNEEQIWTSGRDKIMKLFNISRGSLIRSVKSKSGYSPGVISVTKSGDLLYTDDWDNTVNIERDGNIEEVLRFQTWKVGGVCCTCSGDLLVTLSSDVEKQSKVICYSGSTEKQTIQFDDEGNPLYSYGDNKYICENKNQDICVIDSSARAIVVVNQLGKLRFIYTGHYPVQNNQQFNPRGITTNSVGQLLVADYNNDCVHIIDQAGQFLGYIDSGLAKPWGLCTDSKDNLFVAQKGIVKKGERRFHPPCTIL